MPVWSGTEANQDTTPRAEFEYVLDKPYGVRLTGVVHDPEGYSWGFMRRLQN
jgi:hypothetical protein